MAKHNVVVPVSAQLRNRVDATVNHEGGLAFTMDPLSRLYTRLTASLMGEDKFTTDASTSDAELVADVAAAAEANPEGVLRLAAYARQVMNMRSAPIATLVLAAAIPACKPFVRKWTPEIVRRADEPAEVIAYWVKRHGAIGSHGAKGGEHAFPNALSNGLADALRRFDEYQFAKYDRDGSVKLRDVLRIVRPKPESDQRAALYRYLVKGDIDATHLPKLAAKAELLRKETFDAEAALLAARSHATWEVLVSKFGSKPEVWNALDLPFMAGLRNLSNIMRTGADEALGKVMSMFRDPDQVRRSRLLPFRFFSAFRALGGHVSGGRRGGFTWEAPATDDRLTNHPRRAEVLDAIQTALEASLANLPRLTGRSFVTADNSGSMDSLLSNKGTVTHRDVANLLAAMAHAMCDNAIVSSFACRHQVLDVSRKDALLTNMTRIAQTDVGGSTNAWLTVRHLRETKTRVDRIILLSDMQCYDSVGRGDSLAEEVRKYRSSVNPDVFVYSVDLAGHGTSQFPADDRRVALLAGWSDRLLEFIPLFEADGSQAVDRILSWEPRAVS